jgi:hypothetical protein
MEGSKAPVRHLSYPTAPLLPKWQIVAGEFGFGPGEFRWQAVCLSSAVQNGNEEIGEP